MGCAGANARRGIVFCANAPHAQRDLGVRTGGSVLTTLFSVLLGGLALGQAAPLLQVNHAVAPGVSRP